MMRDLLSILSTGQDCDQSKNHSDNAGSIDRLYKGHDFNQSTKHRQMMRDTLTGFSGGHDFDQSPKPSDNV